MSYHPLANDTGGTADDRRSEAKSLLKIIGESRDLLEQKEEAFIEDMISALSDPDEEGTVSPKQLFWLRDIKDKYL
jgi:hypothetical protein